MNGNTGARPAYGGRGTGPGYFREDWQSWAR
jgi:hypothetical protein